MSDLKKWMNIVEQIMPTVIGAPVPSTDFAENEVVIISPASGGGVGRFMHCMGDICIVDVKGIAMEFQRHELSKPPVIDQDPFTTGHNKSHINIMPTMDEMLRDRPDPQTGDLVRIENVYGTGIGPGFGVFMAYSTTGEEAIVSFDGQVLTVPVEQISSVVEQDAEDEFETTGNDGALSPMSLGAENRQPETTIDGDTIMSQNEQFAKWMKSVEEGLRDEVEIEVPSADASLEKCSCRNWDCPICFPDDHMAHDHEDHTEVLVLDDEFSEDEFDIQKEMPAPVEADASEDVSELIGKIQYMQDMGLSASDKHYDPEQLMNISNASVIKRIYDKVMGNVQEQVHEDSAVETKLADSLSPIDKKIAIAKAALAHKSECSDEEDDETIEQDHGIESKVTDEEDMLLPDPEIMEWAARFAARDKLVQENTTRTPAAITNSEVTPAAETTIHEGADQDTLDWMARFNKLGK